MLKPLEAQPSVLKLQLLGNIAFAELQGVHVVRLGGFEIGLHHGLFEEINHLHIQGCLVAYIGNPLPEPSLKKRQGTSKPEGDTENKAEKSRFASIHLRPWLEFYPE